MRAEGTSDGSPAHHWRWRERRSTARGQARPPRTPESPSTAELTWAREFITRRRWREAATYRDTAPHEYTVRSWNTSREGIADFERFATFIRRFGYADFYYRIRLIYWAVDEFKYWTMGWPLDQTKIINRAPVDAPEPWKKP
jgi:hypothetical protein